MNARGDVRSVTSKIIPRHSRKIEDDRWNRDKRRLFPRTFRNIFCSKSWNGGGVIRGLLVRTADVMEAITVAEDRAESRETLGIPPDPGSTFMPCEKPRGNYLPAAHGGIRRTFCDGLAGLLGCASKSRTCLMELEPFWKFDRREQPAYPTVSFFLSLFPFAIFSRSYSRSLAPSFQSPGSVRCLAFLRGFRLQGQLRFHVSRRRSFSNHLHSMRGICRTV